MIEKIRLKYLCSKITDGSHFSPEVHDEGKHYITVSDVYDDQIHYENAKCISEQDFNVLVKNGCQPNIGDILLAKDGTVGRTAIVSDNDCVILSSLGILRPSDKISSKMLKYILDSDETQQTMKQKMAGSAIKRITISKIQEFKVTVPPLSEQKQIVEYLDAKTASIDSAIQAQKAIVEKQKEYRQSVITEAVTKGLNRDAEMKDSGIEWIGEIPNHWDVLRMKHVAWLKGRIGWDGLKAEEFVENGPYLITGTDFGNGKVNWETCAHITKARFKEDELLHIKENDLLITKDGTVGKVAVAKDCPDEVSLNSGVMIIRNNSNYRFHGRYMYYLLLSEEFIKWFELNQKPGSTIQHLYQHQFENFRFTFPPLDEQQKIADFLDSKTATIDKAIEQKNAIIEKLEEYKKSIIYNAVTGKIDCRKDVIPE